jgi:hypothetical protein
MTPRHAVAPGRRPLRVVDGALVCLLAPLPFLPTLWAGILADDFFFTTIFAGMPVPFAEYVLPALLSMKHVPTTFYRPLAFVTLYGEMRAWGVWPLPMHATNLALHGLAAAGVWWLASRLATGPQRRVAAVIGALAWAWFPRRVEAVAWLSCRPDVLATAIGTWAIVAWVEAEERGARWLRGAAVVLWIAAMASKESVVVLPLVLLAVSPRRGESWARSTVRLWPFAAALAAFLIARRLALGAWIGGYGAAALQPAFLTAVKHLVYPTVPPLTFLNRPLLDHTVNLVTTGAMGIVTLALWAWIFRWRSEPAVRAGAAWVVAAALPVITLLPSLSSPMNDRLLHLSGIGFGLVLAGWTSHAGRAARCAVGLIVVLLTAQTIALAEAWRLAGTLTERLVEEVASHVRAGPGDVPVLVAAAPDSYRGALMLRNGLGFALQRLGAPGPERVAILSSYLLEDAEVMPVTLVRESPAAFRLQGRDGRPEIIGPAVPFEWMDFDTRFSDDRFGRLPAVPVRLRRDAYVLLVSPSGVEAIGMVGPGAAARATQEGTPQLVPE